MVELSAGPSAPVDPRVVVDRAETKTPTALSKEPSSETPSIDGVDAAVVDAILDRVIEKTPGLSAEDKKTLIALISGESVPGLGPKTSQLSAILEFKAELDEFKVSSEVASSQVSVLAKALNESSEKIV